MKIAERPNKVHKVSHPPKRLCIQHSKHISSGVQQGLSESHSWKIQLNGDCWKTQHSLEGGRPTQAILPLMLRNVISDQVIHGTEVPKGATGVLKVESRSFLFWYPWSEHRDRIP